MRACRIGEQGFTAYVRELHRLHVVTRGEVLSWLALHGVVIRSCEPPLDDGRGLDEQAFAELERELRTP